MDDFIKRLRDPDTRTQDDWNICNEAADEIERLRDELHECARYLEEQVSASYWHIEQPFDANTQRRYNRDMARAHKAFAALGEKE